MKIRVETQPLLVEWDRRFETVETTLIASLRQVDLGHERPDRGRRSIRRLKRQGPRPHRQGVINLSNLDQQQPALGERQRSGIQSQRREIGGDGRVHTLHLYVMPTQGDVHVGQALPNGRLLVFVRRLPEGLAEDDERRVEISGMRQGQPEVDLRVNHGRVMREGLLVRQDRRLRVTTVQMPVAHLHVDPGDDPVDRPRLFRRHMRQAARVGPHRSLPVGLPGCDGGQPKVGVARGRVQRDRTAEFTRCPLKLPSLPELQPELVVPHVRVRRGEQLGDIERPGEQHRSHDDDRHPHGADADPVLAAEQRPHAHRQQHDQRRQPEGGSDVKPQPCQDNQHTDQRHAANDPSEQPLGINALLLDGAHHQPQGRKDEAPTQGVFEELRGPDER